MRFVWTCCFSILCCLLLRVGIAIAVTPAANYHLLKTYDIGGGDGKTEYWDYMTFDDSARRLFLSHGTEVKVVSADTGMVLGTIGGLIHNHGIALVKDLGEGFISDGGGNRVVIFDLATLKVVGQVATGTNPDCILYDPVSRHIFVMDGGTKDATVIDPTDGSVIGTVPLGGRPEYAVSDGKGMIYDNIEDKSEVVALDTRTLTIRSRWTIAPAGEASAMAMDTEHRRLFIGGRNKIFAVMNADSGKVIQTFPIGDGVDANVYERNTGLVFSSVREGILYIFHEDTPDQFSFVRAVKTQFGARTMGLDAKTYNIFLDTAEFGPPPAPTATQPHPQPVPIPGTFRLLVFGR